MKLTESGNDRSEQLLVMPTEQATDCWRALEWNAMFEGPAGFLDFLQEPINRHIVAQQSYD